MSVEITTLANGLRVVTDTMPAVETVSLGVWVGVGTRHEAPEVNGVAHLLEHMAFKGTARRTSEAIAREIEDVGGHINAYTSRELTAYYAKVLKDDAPLAADILADILQNSLFEEGELARERAVVLQEIGQAHDTPDDIVFDHFQEAAFPGQALGRPVLGRADIVGRMERRAIVEFVERHYGGEGMVLSAAGAIEHTMLVELAERWLGGLKAPAAMAVEPSRYQGGEHREPRDLEQVHFVLGFPGVDFNDPDYYALQVFSTLLGGGMSSRLFQEVREKRGLVYSIYSFTSAYADGGLFGVYAGTGEAEVEEMLPVIVEQMVTAPDTLDEAELARAKAQLRAGLLMARESTSARSEQTAQQMLVYGRPIPPAELLARVEAVDRAAMGRVVRRLVARPPTVAAIGPLGKLESYDRIAGRFA